MTARLIITPHAVEQYRRRWAPDVSIDGARADLEARVNAGASPTKTRTHAGDEIWRSDDVRLVVKRDHGGAAPVIVTVLPREDVCSGELFIDYDPRGQIAPDDWVLRDARREVGEKLESLRAANRAYDSAKRHLDEVEHRLARSTLVSTVRR